MALDVEIEIRISNTGMKNKIEREKINKLVNLLLCVRFRHA